MHSVLHNGDFRQRGLRKGISHLEGFKLEKEVPAINQADGAINQADGGTTTPSMFF